MSSATSRMLALVLATLTVGSVGVMSAMAVCDDITPSGSVGACTTTQQIGGNSVTCSFFNGTDQNSCTNCGLATNCYHIENSFPTSCVTLIGHNCNMPNANCYVNVTGNCSWEPVSRTCNDPSPLPQTGWIQKPKRTDATCGGS